MAMQDFKSYWENFLINGKYDGIAFEDFIEELLSLMYGKKWDRTPKTHDGSKDFYLVFEDEILWAECKNYKDSISLKTLAPTLVMAQVCNANVILFFSRSAINHFAKEKITTYAHNTSKKVIFYDGELLEKLIIKHNNNLSSKYQLPLDILTDDKTVKVPLKVAEFYFPSILSKMITTEEDYVSYKDTTFLHYNEPFSLLITVCNNSIEKSKVTISFAENNPDRNYYEYLNESISYDSALIKEILLEPGESTAVSLNLRVISFKKNLYFPNFCVTYTDTHDQMQQWFSEQVKIECKWVGLTKLLGSHYNDILCSVENVLINNSEFSALLLTGSSGTGKSRVLNECCCPLLKSGYRILELNVTREHSTNNLIKEIIYFLYEVPAELITQVVGERIEGKNYVGLNTDMDIVIQIAKMINSLDEDLAIFITQYKELLFEKLSQKKIAIMVDNMQFASEDFQQFWRYYIEYSVNQCRPNQTILITTVNLDYISEESAKTIYALQNSNIKHFVNEFIDGFKDIAQGILFLRELMHIDNDNYNFLFKEIVDIVSLNPFNLYQMVKLLEEDEIIKHSSDKQGYLLTTEAIWRSTWRVPNDINDVLKRRFEYVAAHIDKNSLNLILSACYLLENIDDSAIKTFKICLADLHWLAEHQIIMNTEQGYVFVHDIIRKYYEQYWTKEHLFCLQKVESVDSLKPYGSIYKLYRLCILEDEKYIISLCKNHNLSNVPVRLQKIFLEKLFEQCMKGSVLKQDIRLWFGTMEWICNCSRSVMGTTVALQYYKKIYNCIENEFDELSDLCCSELRHLLHSYCDIYIQMHQREKAISFAYEIINKLSKEPVSDKTFVNCAYDEIRDEYYVLKAIMFNRIFCAYNNALPTAEIMLERNEAIKNSRLLIPLIQNEHKRNLIGYLNNSDDGYRYYGFKSEYENLMCIWEKCLIDIPSLAPEKTMNYYRKQVQCHLIKQDAEGVKKYISEGRNYLKTGKYSHEPLIFNTFFTMAEIVNNLQHTPKEMYLYTESLLDKLTTMQLLLKSNKMGDIYLLKGINAYYMNDLKTVYHALKKAYHAYNEKETSYFWIKRELMKENIITAYAILKINENDYDISFLPQACREQLFQFSQKKFQAKGIIQTKDKLFNLPLVV